MKILNFGSLNIDYVYNVDHFVRPGETLASSKLDIHNGGKGLNQSIALARAGAKVFHAGGVGRTDGYRLIDALNQNNVDTSLMKIHNLQSGHAIIQVDSSGQNCIILFGGANQMQTVEYVDEVMSNFSSGDFIIVQNEINLLDYILKVSKERKLQIVLNPSPMNEALTRLPLEYVNYFILNEIEAADICGKSNNNNLIDSLSRKYPESKIILTLGKSGVKYKDKNKEFSHGIYDVDVVDTTAAGDTFTGYFVASVAKGKEIKEALRIASVASSIAVSRHGAESSVPFINEVENSDIKLLR